MFFLRVFQTDETLEMENLLLYLLQIVCLAIGSVSSVIANRKEQSIVFALVQNRLSIHILLVLRQNLH